MPDFDSDLLSDSTEDAMDGSRFIGAQVFGSRIRDRLYSAVDRSLDDERMRKQDADNHSINSGTGLSLYATWKRCRSVTTLLVFRYLSKLIRRLSLDLLSL